MTIFLLMVWVILTRAGSTVAVWPGAPTSGARTSAGTPGSKLLLDTSAVSLEAGVSAVALMLIPWATFSSGFADWEIIGLLALWPFVLRYALDRVFKLRAGHLAEATADALVMPGLPRRVIPWQELRTVTLRKVLFGPDDVVFRGRGLFPVVLDTQFCTIAEDEMVAWAAVSAEAHAADDR